MIEYLIILAISLIIRLLPVRNNTIGFDTYGHLYLASELKKQNAGLWKGIILNCWNSEKFHHPFFWHWLVSFFPMSKVLSSQRWINGFLDSIFTVFLYFLLIKLNFSQYYATLGIFLYLFTPMWFSSISMGPRIDSFTPRLFSELCLNILFVFILIDFGIDNIQKFILITMLSFVIILSSKFGIQALIFLTPFVSLFVDSFEPIFAIIASILLAGIASRGKFFLILIRQLTHLYEYYRSNKNGVTAISKRNKISKIFYNPDKSKANLKNIVLRLISENSYTAVFFKMPVFIITLYLIFHGFSVQAVNLNFISPILSSTIIYIFVNRPTFLFLGEAERYINHISIFIIITCISLATQLNVDWLLWALIMYGLLYWFLEIILIGKVTSQKNRKSADTKIERYLIDLKDHKLVLSFPYHNFCLYRVMLCTPHQVIFPYHMKEKIRKKFIERYEFKYPYLDLKKLDDLSDETGCDMIIVDKNALSSLGMCNWIPSQKWEKVELDQSVYHIYERQ